MQHWEAAAVFHGMNTIWSLPKISLKIKLHLFSAIVIPTAIYSNLSVSINRRLNIFHQRCLRRILNVRVLNSISIECLWSYHQWWSTLKEWCCTLHNIIACRRPELASHSFRMENYRIPKIAMRKTPLGAKHTRGTWWRTFIQDFKTLNIKQDPRPVQEILESPCCPICYLASRDARLVVTAADSKG